MLLYIEQTLFLKKKKKKLIDLFTVFSACKKITHVRPD